MHFIYYFMHSEVYIFENFYQNMVWQKFALLYLTHMIHCHISVIATVFVGTVLYIGLPRTS